MSRMSSPVIAGLGALGVVGLAVGGFQYASLWPGSQLFGHTLIAPLRPGELALTFDDGPNPACTPRLLDILAEHDVRATFFSVGRFAQAEPALLRQVFDMTVEHAPFIQFTYGATAPIPPGPGHVASGSRRIWLNVPPARVWVYRRAP